MFLPRLETVPPAVPASDQMIESALHLDVGFSCHSPRSIIGLVGLEMQYCMTDPSLLQIYIAAFESDWVFGNETPKIWIVEPSAVVHQAGEIVALAAGEAVKIGRASCRE